MRKAMFGLLMIVTASMAGCPGLGEARNPFLTATEEYGITTGGNTDTNGGGSGREATAAFRKTLTLTLANLHTTAELNVSMAAWVSPSSIRNEDQENELLENGYYELDDSVQIGEAFTLVPGTFVYGGPGIAGTTSMRILHAGTTVTETDPDQQTGGEEIIEPTERSFEMITPDVVLIYSQPPVSCDSLAFYYTIDGDPLTSEGLSGVGDLYAGPNSAFGGLKTLAQVDVYQCDPLKPGLFFWQGGGAQNDNEYLEGQNLRFEFRQVPTENDDFCVVTKS